MVLPLLTALLFQTPKSFEELEIAKVVDYHNVKRMHIELLVHLGDVVRHSFLFRDGARNHSVVEGPDGGKIESIDDGTTTCVIVHSHRQYWQVSDTALPPFSAKDNLLASTPQSFNIAYGAAQPVQFASDPPLQLQPVSTTTGSSVTVTAHATSAKGNHLQVLQQFLAKQWIVTHAEVRIQSDSRTATLTVDATTLDFNPIIDPKEFALDPAKIAGYQKMPGLPPAHF